MSKFNIIYLSIAIVLIAIRAYFDYKKNRKKNDLLKAIERNKPKYNQYKILPFNVKPLDILESETGLLRLAFTPTSFQQFEECVFAITAKAKYEDTDIGFEFYLNANPQVEIDPKTEKEYSFNVFVLNGQSKFADRFLKVLANLFEVEISNKTQIVKELFLVSEEEKITSESLHQGQEFIIFFADKEPSISTPAIRLIVNLNKGEVFLEELDAIFRPIIIDRLSFKPNIKS